MAKHFITGVCGFVGSHLARKLLENDNEVWGIDNLVCGFDENIKDIIDDKNFHFSKLDILDEILVSFPTKLKRSRLQTIMPRWGGDIDYVWHLAARGEVYWCRDNPKEALDVNVKGTLNVLQLAKQGKCKHFFFADTSAEYDSFEDEQYYPTAEWMAPNTITPMGYYPITKMCASQFVRSFGKKNGFGTTLFRYTNIYGPSMNLDRDIPPVVGAFTSRLFTNQEPIIYGSGSKRRDFLYIDDLMQFHRAAFKYRSDKLDSQTYNAGSGKNYSIMEVYRKVYKACRKITRNIPSLIEYKPNQPDEAQVTLANIEKASTDLNWEPIISFDEGVDRTVESLAKMLGVKNDSKSNAKNEEKN